MSQGPNTKKILYANKRFGDPDWGIKYNSGLYRFMKCPEYDCYLTTKDDEYLQGEIFLVKKWDNGSLGIWTTGKQSLEKIGPQIFHENLGALKEEWDNYEYDN